MPGDEPVEAVGVGHGIAVHHPGRIAAEEQFLHRHLQLLARQRARHLGHRFDHVRHEAGRDLGPDPGADAVHQRFVQRDAGGGHDEEGHETVPAQIFAINDQRIGDFVQPLDHAVDLGRAQPQPVAVDRRVRAAIDHCAAIPGDLDPVTMPPDARVGVEIAVQIPPVAGIVPEIQGHGGQGLGADQFPHLIENLVARLVKGPDGIAEEAALHLARADRQHRVSADESPAKIGPAGQRREPEVGFHRRIDPVIALGREGRACGAEVPER